MAIPDNLKNVKQDLQDINELASVLESSFTDIAKSTSEFAKNNEDAESAIGKSTDIVKGIASAAKELAGFGEENLKNQKEVNKLENTRRKLLSSQRRLDAKLLELKGRRLNATKAEQKEIDKTINSLTEAKVQSQDLAQNFDDILDTSKKIEKTNPFKGLGDLINEIPVLRKFFPEFEKASQTFRDNMAEGEGFLKSSGKAAGQLAGFFNKLTVGLAVKGLQDFDERSTSLSRNLNTSREQANELVKSANNAARSIQGITGKNITEAQTAFANALGTTATLSNETASNFSTLQNRLGLSVDQATEFTKLNEALGKSSKEQTESLISQVQLNNAQTNSSIKYQDVIKDIASSNKAILLSARGNTVELGRAAIEARKFGISLEDADKLAGSLLNFESSIAAELEAELLTGRQLNLEAAREAALRGDLATVTSEIAKNVGSAEEFGRMNRIQQEAIAKAVGMSREELAASLVEQQALTKLGAKDKNDLRAKTQERLKQINLIEDEKAREKARAQLIKDLGSDELIRQQETRNLQELQAEAAQKIVEAFDKLSPVLDFVRGLFEKINENAQGIAVVLGGIMGLSLIGKFSKLLGVFKKIGSAASKLKGFFGGGGSKVTSAVMKTGKNAGKIISGASAQSAVKAGTATAVKTGTKSGTKVAAKTGAKLGGKTLLKRIPILGSVVGLGFAIDRAIKGDFAGAAMEVGSAGLGLLDLVVPGLGTGLSLAADAGIAARDFKRAGTITPTATPMATGEVAEDFISRPGQPIQKFRKDDIIIGGTSLGGGNNNEVISLLKELISEVRAGGDVYIDGSKVGKTLQLASSRMG